MTDIRERLRELATKLGQTGTVQTPLGANICIDAICAIEKMQTAITRESREDLFSGEELAAANKLGDEVCDYIERCRTDLHLDGAIRAGVDHIIRKTALPWLSQRPKIIDTESQ